MTANTDALVAWLHSTWLARYPILEVGAERLLAFLVGPLTGLSTRYYWVFIAEAAVLIAVTHLWQGGRFTDLAGRLLPSRQLLHRSTATDLQLNIANALVGPGVKLFWRLSAPTAVAADLLQLAQGVVGPPPHYWHFTTASLGALTVLVLVADDLGYYVFHRACHRMPWLWALHKVHHSAEVLTPLVAGRVHPLEMALSEPVRAVFTGCVLAPALFFFGGEPNLLTVWGVSLTSLVFGALGNQLLHSEVPLSFGDRFNRIFVSPAVHQIHHSAASRHHNRNLGGLLSVWDWLFGTLYLPRPEEALTFGLAEGEAQIHPHVLAAYLQPFLDIAVSIWRRLHGRARLPGRGGLSP